ncbi:MAG: hypothetical protein IJX62_02810 [Clostridia bacterium]|nr:hypothetical protein [Clostridia bacterium]
MKPIWKRYERKGRTEYLSSYITMGLTLFFLVQTIFNNLAFLTPTIACALFLAMLLQGNAKVIWKKLRDDGLIAMKKATDHVYRPPYKNMIGALLMLASPFFVVLIILGALFAVMGGWTIVFTVPAWVASFVNFAAWQDAWVIDMCGKKKYYWGILLGVVFGIALLAVIAYVIVQIHMYGELPGR